MNNRRAFRRVVVALVLLLAFLSQGTWTLAGTTGGMSGQVSDDKGAPVAGAAIRASSPQQTALVVTDAGGHFAFLNLAPDTYTITATKDGYTPVTYPGNTVFADQNVTLAVQMPHAGLKNIANVTARAASSLVKPGTTADVYSINATTATQLQMAAGGNNLDSAYSAIYSQPGVNPLPGNFGFGQVFYIHGSSYNQIGYEFDGIPVNRAFDNYNASSLSSLGTAQTEVYTGGAPADATAATLGGYINQVIKTGTYPGYIDLHAGLGAPAYYHQAQIEAGGATPDRLFSYYVGIRGADQIPNQINAQNGGNLAQDGDNQYGLQGTGQNVLLTPMTAFAIANTRGPWATCNPNGTAPAGAAAFSPFVSQALFGQTTLASCQSYGPIYGALTTALRGNDLSDRENVMNFHIGIPHRKDGGKDDVQILFDNFYYQTTTWDNVSTNGGLPFTENAFADAGNANGTGLYNTFLGNALGHPGTQYLPPAQMPQYAGVCAYINLYALFGDSTPCPSTGYSPMPYADAYQVTNAHFGQAAAGATNIVSPYLFPSSPTDRAFGSGFSPYQVSNTGNNASIVKLQYTKNFSSNAYLRIAGYTFYSDWLQTDPNHGLAPFLTGAGTQADYELYTHTAGGLLNFADQLNSQNLLTFAASYTTANYERLDNLQYEFTPNGTPIATLTSGNACYSGQTNNPTNATGKALANAPRVDGSYAITLPIGSPVSCMSALAGQTIDAVVGNTLPGVQGMAASKGASWQLTQNLEPYANKNTVSPRFLTGSLQDEFRPSDRWDINAAVRYESYGYVLGQVGSPEQQFWFNQINSTVCVDPSGLTQVLATDFTGGIARYGNVPEGYPDYYTTAPGGTCQVDPLTKHQLYHPGQNGVPQLSLGGTGTITDTTFSPKIGATYTVSPNAVLRFSYGRYTQPTQTASEQVLTYEDGYQMASNLYGSAYYNNGFSTITHDNPIQFSNNWDASYEQHLNGTDWSFKLSPFYRYTSNQSVEVALPGGLSGSFNSGTQKTQGVELAVDKGDPSRNGFSGQLSYTYTFSQLKYSLINGSNIISTELANLQTFYGFTKNGGGSPCYGPGGVPEANCQQYDKAHKIPASEFIVNPYYDMLPNDKSFAALQAQFPVNGWYPTYANLFPYGLQLGDASTALAPNIFSSYVSWKHNRFQTTVTGNLWEGTQYGAPTDILGLNPTSCLRNQGASGVIKGSQLADYQTCGGQVAIPNPYTGQFDGIGQYRQPWQFNLGMQFAYDFTPRIRGTIALANIFNACFGGSAEPWTAAYRPNSVDCGYFPNTSYLGATPGAGYFYGNSPHSPVNGTAGYPKVFDQAYLPGPVQISAPFQAYFQLNVRM
jgi:Carboxypeptidase regulatory-like domain/TonB dependent receptor/TonB-dependent Receptor Plug Domain